MQQEKVSPLFWWILGILSLGIAAIVATEGFRPDKVSQYSQAFQEREGRLMALGTSAALFTLSHLSQRRKP